MSSYGRSIKNLTFILNACCAFCEPAACARATRLRWPTRAPCWANMTQKCLRCAGAPWCGAGATLRAGETGSRHPRACTGPQAKHCPTRWATQTWRAPALLCSPTGAGLRAQACCAAAFWQWDCLGIHMVMVILQCGHVTHWRLATLRLYGVPQNAGQLKISDEHNTTFSNGKALPSTHARVYRVRQTLPALPRCVWRAAREVPRLPRGFLFCHGLHWSLPICVAQ